MKERPILFSAPMVRAILDGRKTQTRRIAPITELDINQRADGLVTWRVEFAKPVKGSLASYSGGRFTEAQARSIIASQFNPFGQPGDQLWVKETWGTSAGWDQVKPTNLPDDQCGVTVPIRFAADGGKNDGRWRPSIFMRRWMSRITLEITAVRVERLNAISEEDAQAEGVSPECGPEFLRGGPLPPSTHYLGFKHIWQNINGDASWAANPWVWVLAFKRVEIVPAAESIAAVREKLKANPIREV